MTVRGLEGQIRASKRAGKRKLLVVLESWARASTVIGRAVCHSLAIVFPKNNMKQEKHPMKKMKFTLIELMVVIAILAIIASLVWKFIF